MPPRRTARVVSGASAASTSSTEAPAATKAASAAARPTRGGRKPAAREPTPESDEDDAEEQGGFPGNSDEEEEAEAPVPVKPKRGRPPKAAASAPKASKAKAPAKAAASAPKRRSARQSISHVEEEEEDDPLAGGEAEEAEQEEEDEEEVPVKPTKGRTSKAKAPAVPEPELNPAPPAASKGRKSAPVEDTDSEDEEELQAALRNHRPRGDDAASSIGVPSPSKSVAETERTVQGDQSQDEDDEDEEGDETVRLDSSPGAATAADSRTPTRAVPSTPAPAGRYTDPVTPHRAPPQTPLRGGAGPSMLGSTPAPPPPPTGPKPRLTIHKLVLVNFKSYAGRQEIGPFHKSFSAIVGPNGSGKSNTIDALLFVFGYRASKMRQGKLSELIHNSAGKEGLETCSVEVWFREIVDLPGVDDFLLVPNSQLVVTRTAYRNNSSKYTINDRTSSFTEVTTLLKGKGIDLDHNRFLILQGEVESIAQMKAKAQNEHEDGLLEYLEDIIGTTKYKEPIEQASQEVETLNEARGEKMNRLRVVEREKAALEDKKQEAEDYLRQSNDLTRKKSLLWQFHMHTLSSNIEITTKAVESLNAQLVHEQERNAHHLAEIDSLQNDYDQKLADFETVKQFSNQLSKDVKGYEKEEVGLLEKKKHLVAKQKKLKKSLQDDGHARSEALNAYKDYGENLETTRVKVADLEQKLETEYAELEEIRDSLKDKTDQFTTQIEAKQRELEPWTAKISEKQSAIDVATSERDLLVQKAEGAQAALAEARETLESLKQGGQGKHDEYAALKKEAAKVRKSLAEGEDKLQDFNARAEQLRAKVSASRQKTDEARASLAADKSENAVLNSLNKLKEQGRVRGFHGRLGDLGVIDDKYDVAVTTACGALNNLVVDTVEQGQACIEHLRKGNVGRASFMVLEKLPSRDLGPIDTPESVPRLFDLIKPKDPRFAPAFYKGLFNTLVADDLAQAQRIGFGGKKRWRVVTLAGQLIDPSGTMSGGGTRVSRGGMSSKFAADKVAPEVVARYEKESAAAEEDFTRFQAEKRTAEAELAALKKRLPEIEMQMEKIELDVRTSEKRVAEAEKRLAELKTQNKPDVADEKRVKALETEIATFTKEADKLREKSSAITDTIKELQNKILEVGGVKLRAIQSKVSTTKGLLDLANETITKAEVGQAKAERDAEKLKKAIDANQAKLAEVEEELEALGENLAALQGDLATIRQKLQEAVDANTDVQDALKESKAELDEKTTEINAFRKLEMDIKQKIEDNQRAQKDSKDKMRHWKKRHDELELAYVDEEDEEEEEAEAEKAGDAEGDDAAASEAGEAGEAAETTGGTAAPVKKAGKRKTETTELEVYSPDELRGVDKEVLNAEISQLEEEIARMKPNLNVLAEYRKREAEFLDRAKDMESVTAARDDAKKRYDDLRKVRLDEFMAGFTAISAKLKEMYQMITMGGNAEIELIDSMDPFSEGVVLSIMPPKKSWRAIANLSGGEKTLASLALVFALHVFKPTPLYFMDEIDAALDFKNVSIVANYIQSKTQAAQFIVISLRNDMFELAHRLVGIYKTSNCTKSIAIDNKDLRTQALVPKGKRNNQSASPEKPDRKSQQQQQQAGARRAPSVVPATPGSVFG